MTHALVIGGGPAGAARTRTIGGARPIYIAGSCAVVPYAGQGQTP